MLVQGWQRPHHQRIMQVLTQFDRRDCLKKMQMDGALELRIMQALDLPIEGSSD